MTEKTGLPNQPKTTQGDVLVIIPAYNESANIAAVVQRVQGILPNADVCVIDDGSTDDTAQQARGAGAITLSLPYNVGIGGAVQTGFLYAERYNYAHMARIDGDGQHPPEQIPNLIAALHEKDVDVIIGSRFITGEQAGYQGTLPRRAGIQFLTMLIKMLTGRTVTDPTSGFLVAGPRGIQFLAHEYPQDYPEPETPVLLHRAGITFAEAQVTMAERMGGVSSISPLRSVYYMFKVTLALALDVVRRPHMM